MIAHHHLTQNTYSIYSIVFVHGVNPTGAATHPYDTWTHAKSHLCWPKDLLGDDVPSARIFIYGYNSNVRNAELMSEARITHHASNLLMLLSDERDASQVCAATLDVAG